MLASHVCPRGYIYLGAGLLPALSIHSPSHTAFTHSYSFQTLDLPLNLHQTTHPSHTQTPETNNSNPLNAHQPWPP